LFLFQIVV